MIKRISIKNIQSHKDTELELSPGINAIVGSSNNGKSAILRALYWVRYNRPLGTDNLLSHWAVDKKGNQIAPMEATVENENGVVTRRRTKDENQYIVNNEELNVVKTDVPAQVEQLLSLSDTNIQRQQDAPFLLSLTSGQVAQYFNKTVRLDVIDKVLSNAESKRRKTMQEITQNDELCNEYKQRKEKYDWLDAVEKLLVKYDNISQKNDEIQNECDILQQQIERYKKFANIKEKYSFIANAKKNIDKLEKLEEVCNKLKNEITALDDLSRDWETCQSRIYPSFEMQKTLIDKIKNIDNDNLKDEINYLQEKINNYKLLQTRVEKCRLQAVDLKKQLPKTCPLCGAIMKEGVCENE